MSILEDIFGGGDQTTTTQATPFDPTAARSGMDWLTQNQGTRKYYPGQTYAGFDPLQTQAQEMRLGAAEQVGSGAQNLWNAQQNYLDPSFLDPANNPYINEMMTAATRGTYRQLDEGTLPAIRGNARMTGGQEFGSTRPMMMEAIASRGAEDRASDIRAGLLSDVYGQNLSAQQNAMRMNPMVAAMMGLPAEMVGGVGAERRGMEGLDVAEDVARYGYERDIPYEDMYRNLALNFGAGGTTSTTPGAGPLAGMLGAGMMAYGMPPLTMMGSPGSPASTTMPRY